MPTHAQPIETKVESHIYGKGRGWAFTQKDSSDLGNYFAIRKALLSLVDRKLIRRVAQSIYEYPRVHKRLKLDASLAPTWIAQIVKSITCFEEQFRNG